MFLDIRASHDKFVRFGKQCMICDCGWRSKRQIYEMAKSFIGFNVIVVLTGLGQKLFTVFDLKQDKSQGQKLSKD